MSEPIAADIEVLLRRRSRRSSRRTSLADRLESTLQELTELAAEELESWELGSMRDPRNWVRPVAAVAVGTAAGAALVRPARAQPAPQAAQAVPGRSSSPSARCATRADEARRRHRPALIRTAGRRGA